MGAGACGMDWGVAVGWVLGSVAGGGGFRVGGVHGCGGGLGVGSVVVDVGAGVRGAARVGLRASWCRCAGSRLQRGAASYGAPGCGALQGIWRAN